MAIDRLGSSLYDALKKVFRASVVDEATVKELVRDIQRASVPSGCERSACSRNIQTNRRKSLKREGSPRHLETRTRDKSRLRRINAVRGRKACSSQNGAWEEEDNHARRDPRLWKNNPCRQACTVLPEEGT